MSLFTRGFVAIVTSLLVSVAQADLELRFVESAPKDRFVIFNTGACDLPDVWLRIDLSDSKGRLIFDTTSAGEGVEVFQPFEVHSGRIELLTSDGVNDGDAALTVQLSDLEAGGQSSFTIDVDDTLPKSELGQIRVSGAEIAGARATVKVGADHSSDAVFDVDSRAVLGSPLCS